MARGGRRRGRRRRTPAVLVLLALLAALGWWQMQGPWPGGSRTQDDRRPDPDAGGQGASGGPVCRVVDGRSARPLPGARVWVDTEVDPWLWSLPGDADPGATPSRYHARALAALRADEEGRVRLPLVHRRAVVEGVAPGLWGRMFTRPEGWQAGEPLLLELWPEAPLAVRVVDNAGDPAPGVDLTLRVPAGGSSVMTDTHHYEATTVGPSGLALFRISPQALPRKAWDRGLTVVLREPLGRPLQEVMRRPRSKDDPLELGLPGTGSLRVRLLDPRGDPMPGPLSASVAALVPGAGRRSVHRSSEDGEVVFPYVGLGLPLEVGLASQAGRLEQVRVRTRSPEREGETVEVAARLTEAFPELLGRALRVDGRPVPPGEELLLLTGFRDAQGVLHQPTWRVASERGGRFRVPVPHGGPGPLWWRVVLDTQEGAGAYAQGRLEPWPPAGAADLGDVVLRPAPLVAAGRVVDPEGRPVPWARLVLDGAGAFSWEPEEGVRFGDEAVTRYADAGGRFRLRAPGARSTLALTIAAQGRHRQAVLAPGAREVVLELPQDKKPRRVTEPEEK